MKLRNALLPALAALLVAGCQSTPPPRDIVINLTSALPVSYSGIVRADGLEQPVNGMTPAELHFKARRVDCKIEQGDEKGTLTIEVRALELPEHLEMVTASTGPNTRARGAVSFR